MAADAGHRGLCIMPILLLHAAACGMRRRLLLRLPAETTCTLKGIRMPMAAQQVLSAAADAEQPPADDPARATGQTVGCTHNGQSEGGRYTSSPHPSDAKRNTSRDRGQYSRDKPQHNNDSSPAAPCAAIDPACACAEACAASTYVPRRLSKRQRPSTAMLACT